MLSPGMGREDGDALLAHGDGEELEVVLGQQDQPAARSSSWWAASAGTWVAWESSARFGQTVVRRRTW